MGLVCFPLTQTSYGTDPLWRLIDSLFGSGVVGADDFKVTQKAGGADMSVDVNFGVAMVAYSGSGKRQIASDSVNNSGTPGSPGGDWLNTFSAAHPTLPRIDRVVLRVRDGSFGDSTNRAWLDVITGTATAGATLVNLSGASAVPANSMLLANVLIPTGSITITDASIDTTVRTLAQIGAGLAAGAAITAIGDYKMSAAAADHGNWFVCDGRSLDRTTYAALFAVIGTAFGTVDGSHFNLPDGRGRVLVSKGTHTNVDTLGKDDGLAVASRSPKHKHTVTDPQHSHHFGQNVVNAQSGSDRYVGAGPTYSTTSDPTGITVGPAGSYPTDNPAFVVAGNLFIAWK